MGLQKHRATRATPQPDGSVLWHGRGLVKVGRCRIAGREERRTVYVTGEPDSWVSQPAACRLGGRTVRGWLKVYTPRGGAPASLVFVPREGGGGAV